MRALVFTGLVVLLPASFALAQPDSPAEPPDGLFLLVHSELEYLDVADRRISIAFKDVSPRTALEQLDKMAGLTITVQGRLPETPRLTASFRDATVKKVLQWFAREVAVFYQARDTDRLLVVAHDDGKAG